MMMIHLLTMAMFHGYVRLARSLCPATVYFSRCAANVGVRQSPDEAHPIEWVPICGNPLLNHAKLCETMVSGVCLRLILREGILCAYLPLEYSCKIA